MEKEFSIKNTLKSIFRNQETPAPKEERWLQQCINNPREHQVLSLNNCDQITDLAPLANLTQLQRLYIFNDLVRYPNRTDLNRLQQRLNQRGNCVVS